MSAIANVFTVAVSRQQRLLRAAGRITIPSVRRAAPIVTILLAVALGYGLARSLTVAAIVVGAVCGVAAWWLLTRWSSVALAFILPVFGLALLAPQAIEAVAELGLVAYVSVATLSALQRGDRRGVIGLACLTVSGLWMLLAVNPNVPNLATALIGTRKSTLVFMGLGAGVLWPTTKRRLGERLIMVLLCAGGLLSLGLYFMAPAVEASLSRKAGLYTGIFAGEARLQGIYPGPFHVALLGSFLLLRAWHVNLAHGKKALNISMALVFLGVPLVTLALVRTAYVTLALGALLTIVFSPGSPVTNVRVRMILRTTALALTLALALGSGIVDSSAVASIPNLGDSSRATNRLRAYGIALKDIGASPVVGDGPGSAGATDGAAFVHGAHITTDDEFLALGVEGGLLGAVAVLAVLGLLMRYRRDIMSTARPAAAALFCLFGFCLTTNAFEAIPVSVFLAMLVGLAVQPMSSNGG